MEQSTNGATPPAAPQASANTASSASGNCVAYAAAPYGPDDPWRPKLGFFPNPPWLGIRFE
eukprot:230784-Pyramimonas_sp.AAC.1